MMFEDLTKCKLF